MGVDDGRHAASFRDPRGYVFVKDGVLRRAILPSGEADYRALMDGGLYAELAERGSLVRHVDEGLGGASLPPDRRAIRPEVVRPISYPAEWTFGQLRSAALLTLELQRRALAKGMSLKDASAFNVQFVGARPVFIDTLSFEPDAHGPWVAYRQFCEHFLGPLALIAHHGLDISALWATSVDGVPLGTVSRLLPMSSWLRPGLLLHIHLHARAAALGGSGLARREPGDTNLQFGQRLAASLQKAVSRLRAPGRSPSSWTTYRGDNSYSPADTVAKHRFVEACADLVRPVCALDLGANDCDYAEALARRGVRVTAIELDADCSERLHERAEATFPDLVTALRVDIANPTAAFGWSGDERTAFVDRMRSDLVLVLALIHHLSLARQIPLAHIAAFLARLSDHVVVEFVPPDDPRAVQLAASRGLSPEGLGYDEAEFTSAFAAHFEVVLRSEPIAAGRRLFLFRRRSVGT